MDFSVDLCHRRPVTRRRLFYLDTSTFGALARGDNGADQLAAVLRDAIDEDSGICVGSPWQDDEIAMLRGGPLLDRMVQTLRTYTLDVRMRFRDELIDRELVAAAREFSGQKDEITWKEAFRSDPDEPPLNQTVASLDLRRSYKSVAAPSRSSQAWQRKRSRRSGC